MIYSFAVDVQDGAGKEHHITGAVEGNGSLSDVADAAMQSAGQWDALLAESPRHLHAAHNRVTRARRNRGEPVFI